MSAAAFNNFLAKLAVSNRDQLSISYEAITAELNKSFWGIGSETAHSLRVGSFGRRTAIHGISDLDMVFELPPESLERYKARVGNGPSAMLADVRDALLKKYKRTKIRGDGPVVVVEFTRCVFEVLPAFRQDDGSYIYGVTKDGGSWPITRPRAEMEAFSAYDDAWGGNLRNVAKMLRAWKNNYGAPMGGYLIDTLAVHFFLANPQFQNADVVDYPVLLEQLFGWMKELDNEGSWPAPGSGDPVSAKGAFTGRASKAWRRCQQAVEAATLVEKTKKWRSVFGRSFPVMTKTLLQESILPDLTVAGEEFVEERFNVDVRYRVKLDYEVTQNKVQQWSLMNVARRRRRVPVAHSLRFYLKECNVPEPFSVHWKVRNRGAAASGKERGDIVLDGGRREKVERSQFEGKHYVEVYIVKDDVCVARDRADVPIVASIG